MAKISVVIPVYNEQACLEALYDRLSRLGDEQDGYEFIFVDDGSSDDSPAIIRRLAEQHAAVKYLILSRNFGHELATTAGLDHATGDAAVIIDADLQDPPEVIPRLVETWRQGYQVVYGQRKARKGETLAKRAAAWLFYRLIRALSNVPIPVDTGDFRLMDRRVVEGFRRCRERSRFVRGLVSWAGFRQTAVQYERDARFGGQSKYGFWKLLGVAFDVVTSFSVTPLRLAMWLGLLVCLVSLGAGAWALLRKVLWDVAATGYALQAMGMFFLGGVQLILLGLLGEYVGRIYSEVQRRPLYVVAEKSESLPQHREGLHES